MPSNDFMENNMYEELENFLSAHFQQDIESSEDELKDFVQSVSKERILLTISHIKSFLNTNITQEEKEDFIEECCELYFPALELTPIKWLEYIAKELESAI